MTDTKITYPTLQQLDKQLPFAHFCEERSVEELKSAGVQVVGFPRIFETNEPEFHSSIIHAGIEANDVIVGMNRTISLTAEEVALMNHLSSLEDITFHTATLLPGGLTRLKPLPKLKKLAFYVAVAQDFRTVAGSFFNYAAATGAYSASN